METFVKRLVGLFVLVCLVYALIQAGYWFLTTVGGFDKDYHKWGKPVTSVQQPMQAVVIQNYVQPTMQPTGNPEIIQTTVVVNATQEPIILANGCKVQYIDSDNGQYELLADGKFVGGNYTYGATYMYNGVHEYFVENNTGGSMFITAQSQGTVYWTNECVPMGTYTYHNYQFDRPTVKNNYIHN